MNSQGMWILKKKKMERIFQEMKVNTQNLLVGAGCHSKQKSED